MVTVECPWCDEPVGLEPSDPFRCDRCAIVMDITDGEATTELPKAA